MLWEDTINLALITRFCGNGTLEAVRIHGACDIALGFDITSFVGVNNARPGFCLVGWLDYVPLGDRDFYSNLPLVGFMDQLGDCKMERLIKASFLPPRPVALDLFPSVLSIWKAH